MNRNDTTEKIITVKVSKGLKWEDVAKKVGLAKKWVTAGCLGQIFGLTAEEQKWLQVVPYKGSLPTAVPTDPLIYRWYEMVNVYGTTIKELIHEEFGDDIMSAIDFSNGHPAHGRPEGQPRQCAAVRQIFAVQAVLSLTATPCGAPANGECAVGLPSK